MSKTTNNINLRRTALTPIALMLLCAASFILFDVSVSVFDTVPLSIDLNVWGLAGVFGLASAGCCDFTFSSQRIRAASFWFSGTLACLSATAIYYEFGQSHWLWLLATIFAFMVFWLTGNGLCRITDQLANVFRKPE